MTPTEREELARDIAHALDDFGCVDWNECYWDCSSAALEQLGSLVRGNFDFDSKELAFKLREGDKR